MVAQANLQGRPIEETNLWLEIRPEGLDLANDRDLSWLMRRVALIKPDVVFLGPLYRLAPRALNSDDEVAPILAALNMIRARGACVLLEAHAGHALGAGGRRDLRPRGSSALLGWPEFGYGIRRADTPEAKTRRIVDVESWRGDRDERDWPERLTAGGAWPWTETVVGFDAQENWTPTSALNRTA
jgi:replicative DNA helicase